MPAEEIGELRERHVVGPDEETRLDVLISSRVKVSRAQAKRWIEAEHVLVNGRPARASRLCRSGELVEISVPAPVSATPLKEPIPLDIVFEDAHLVVVDKPTGMVVHPGAGHAGGTLVNALLAHVDDLSGIGGVLRPGIVHRLDAGTSGLLVVAKHDRAHRHLATQFAEREVEKRYLAIVHGNPPETFFVDNPIGRDPKHRKKISSRSTRARSAQSEVECRERLPSSALVRVRIHTGRTHQIRVHLSEAGYPVVGDRHYGAPRRGPGPDALVRFPRPALHAAELAFRHPETNESMRFERMLPPDMAELIAVLRRCAS